MNEGSRSYSIRDASIPAVDLSCHLQDIHEVRTFLENRGIPTTSTRIDRYAQYLERLQDGGTESVSGEKIFKNSVGEPFRSPADWFLYVLREVHELMWILKGLKNHVPAGADGKLKIIVKGADFAALDKDSQSRDTQFELRIASYFCQSGCEVDMSTNTDVIARVDRREFFIECKRVASKNKLATRLAEARGQLASRLPHDATNRRQLGCIAVDVTKVAFMHNGLTLGVTNEHSRDVIQKHLLEIGATHERSMSFEPSRRLMCYWLQIHIPTILMYPSPPAVATRFSSYHVPRLGLSGTDAKMLATFYGLIESVAQPDQRASGSGHRTPRNAIAFAAGTTFSLECDRLVELLAKDKVSEDEQAEVLGTVTIDGTEHQFTFVEMSLLPARLIDEWKQQQFTDRARSSVALLAHLYLRRYPYED
jgi:hypothetical protein